MVVPPGVVRDQLEVKESETRQGIVVVVVVPDRVSRGGRGIRFSQILRCNAVLASGAHQQL